MKLSAQLSGSAGQYAAATEIAKRGFIPAITADNTKNFDIIVSNEDGDRTITVQVKTLQGSDKWFVLGKKNEEISSEYFIYVFVKLNLHNGGNHEFFIVKSNEVSKTIKEGHRAWLQIPKKNGEAKKDNSIRNFLPREESRNNWQIIENLLNPKIIENITEKSIDELNSYFKKALDRLEYLDPNVNIIKEEINRRVDIELAKKKVTEKHTVSEIWDGYCPESRLQGKIVKMRLNKWDFYESEETGLQIAMVVPGVQCAILKFRGKGNFRDTVQYADDHENGECLSPQTMDMPPFCEAKIFTSSEQIEEYINTEVEAR